MRADPESVERGPERHAPDAAVQHDGGRCAEHQPQERRPDALRVRQLLLLRRREAHGGEPPGGLLRGVPAGGGRDGHDRAPVVEHETRKGVVLHAARRCRKAAAPLRAGHLRLEERTVAERSLRRGPLGGTERQAADADRYGCPEDPPPHGCQAGGLLPGTELRCAGEVDEETEDRSRGAVEISGGKTRPGAAGGSADDLCAAA